METDILNQIEPGRHSHGPNFGRYVEGCSVCEEKKANGGFTARARAERKSQPETAPGVYLTFEQLQELMTKGQTQGADLANALKEFAKELRAPSAEEVEEKAKAEERRSQQRARAIEAAEKESQARQAVQDACESMGHKKDEGRSPRSAIVQGQVYNDGYMRPFCQTCGKHFAPIKATMEMLTSAG